MNRCKRIGLFGILLFLMIACNPATATPLGLKETIHQGTSTTPEVTNTQKTNHMTTPIKPTYTLDSGPFPLSNPGPYMIGKRSYSLLDASRDKRPVTITIWYPALLSESSSDAPFIVGHDRDPDLSGAPYPLILSSTKLARIFAPYLVSHGFTWASVDKIDTYQWMTTEMYEQPLDILFTLKHVASNRLEGLEGMIDAERAGTIGYSFDGYNSLAMSGTRINPDYYLAQCPDPDSVTKEILSSFSSFNCNPARNWFDFEVRAPEAITNSEDGLWQPMTDVRIRAVMPLAPEGWWLFGERGLASVDRPALIIVGTQDALYQENVLIYEHLGTPDKSLISFIGPGHMMIYEKEMVARMAHFAVAFFTYHLQGREDLGRYFSEEYVVQFDDLAWGVYEK